MATNFPALTYTIKYICVCFESLCSTEKKHCDHFKDIFYLINARHPIKSIRTVTKSFNACIYHTYRLKKADICLSEQNCFLSQNSLFRINVTVVRPIQCACSDKHRFQCGSDYCAVSSEACDAFYYGKRQPTANHNLSCNNTKNITRKDTQYLGYLRF